jgi:hypothetical protein
MEKLKRITPGEAKNYRELDIYDPNVCKKAVAYTLTPASKSYPAALCNTPWEEVTYYGNLDDDYSAFPLFQLLNEWNTPKNKDNENLTH